MQLYIRGAWRTFADSPRKTTDGEADHATTAKCRAVEIQSFEKSFGIAHGREAWTYCELKTVVSRPKLSEPQIFCLMLRNGPSMAQAGASYVIIPISKQHLLLMCKTNDAEVCCRATR